MTSDSVRHQIIRDIGAPDLREALASCRALFDTGQALCVQGQGGDEAFVLISGEADVTIEGAGGEGAGGATTVAQLKANYAVGELAILRDSCSDEIRKLSG